MVPPHKFNILSADFPLLGYTQPQRSPQKSNNTESTCEWTGKAERQQLQRLTAADRDPFAPEPAESAFHRRDKFRAPQWASAPHHLSTEELPSLFPNSELPLVPLQLKLKKCLMYL